MKTFRATIAIVGINPYVLLPPAHLKALFHAAGRDKGHLPIKVTLNGAVFEQNLVKHRGVYRLYLNTPMRKAAGKDVGDVIAVQVAFDPEPRVEPTPPAFERALSKDKLARAAFEKLAPSRKKEILRYLNHSKTEATLQRNVDTFIRHLRGESPPTLGPVMRNTKR